MWKGKKVSVVFPTYNEKDSIRQAIIDVLATGVVDEVIVVNNNAVESTDEEVMQTPAQIVYEPRQGYGYAIQRGYKVATGDLVITSEPDGTFAGSDIIKLLSYSDDVDIVFGTRTTSVMIWSGANMGFFLRFGNFIVAKFMEFFFNTTILTDMGCTLKLIKCEVLKQLITKFRTGGLHFNAELMLLVIVNGFRFIEIPVNYKPRVGRSMATGNKLRAILIGVKMIAIIFKYRLFYKVRKTKAIN